MCHTGSLSSVLYAELVAKNVYEFKADVLARQVALPFVAARGEDWRSSIRRSNGREDSEFSRLSEASSFWDDRLFLAGFGNKATDAMAYEMAGMDRCDIYIIDKESRILCMGLDEENPMQEGSGGSSFGGSVSRSGDPVNMRIAEDYSGSMTEARFDNSVSDCNKPAGSIPKVCSSRAEDGQLLSNNNQVSLSTIHSIELTMSNEGQPNTSGNDAVSGTTVNVVYAANEQTSSISPAKPRRSKRSTIRQSVRAFSMSKSSTTKKFPSLTSTGSQASPKTLFDGYTDPQLLIRVRERLIR